MKINAIILGAGNSTRMGTKDNKIFMKIQEKYVLEYSINALLEISDITNIIVVYNEKDINKINQLKNKYNKIKFVQGDTSRQKSLANGLEKIDKDVDKVIIHDAARPLIYLDIVKEMIQTSVNKKVLIPVRKINEGVKLVDNDTISKSINRDKIVLCQTPQIFDSDIIIKLKNNIDKGVITTLLDLNIKMDIYYLEKNFLKITTLEDLYYYEYLIRRITNEKN